MRTKKEIAERIAFLQELAVKRGIPDDPDSIGSVADAMARRKAAEMAVLQLEWVLGVKQR